MGALFDVSFSRFIAPTIAKIVYVLAMIGIAVMYVVFVVTAFQASSALGVVFLLVLGPLVSLLYLVFVRVGIESLLATIQTAENTAELVRLGGGQVPATQGGTTGQYDPGTGPVPPPAP